MLFVSGGPGAGKGTQASLLVGDFGADVRGIDGVDSPQPVPLPRSPSHSPVVLPDGRRFAVVHISVGALLRHQMHSPSPDCQFCPTETDFGGVHWFLFAPCCSFCVCVDAVCAAMCSFMPPLFALAVPTAVQEEISSTLSRGGILPGHITVELLRAEVARCMAAQQRADPSVTPCFVIDGFPRSVDNLVLFEKHVCITRHGPRCHCVMAPELVRSSRAPPTCEVLSDECCLSICSVRVAWRSLLCL